MRAVELPPLAQLAEGAENESQLKYTGHLKGMRSATCEVLSRASCVSQYPYSLGFRWR